MATNLIPSMDARGRFEALAPFDSVVDEAKYYTVEAIRNIHEMEALKVDLFTLVFQPAGYTTENFSAALERARKDGAKVLSLLDRSDVATYVLTTFLKSFPLVDGVSYERMCAIVDFGACPPSMKQILSQELEHIKNHVSANVGIETTVTLGTIPTIGYVSKDQADAYERTRQQNISNSTNDVAKIRELEAKLVKKDAYIQQLEAALANRQTP